MSNDADADRPEADADPESGTGDAPTEGEDDRHSAASRRAERLAHQLAQQWAQLRAERRSEPEPIKTGPSNFSRAQVPWGLDLASAWAWRFLVIAAAGYVILWLLAYFVVITLPLIIAVLIAALAAPLVNDLAKVGVPRAVSAAFVVLGGIAFVASLLTFVGREIAQGASDLADQVVNGLDEIRTWLEDGPLNASDSQIDRWIENAQERLTEFGKDTDLSAVTEIGTAVGHVVAGFFIVLFATFFLLADGERIWAWAVRLFPRAARERVDSSGRIAWVSLTQFVRATVIIAVVDAVGIMLGAWFLGLPLVLPIGVIVFLGAFVPMVGATVAGAVAVLVALVDQGPFEALIMLAVVIGVQQLEGHILQPIVMGRFVAVHPLGVIVAIGCGVIVAGIAGALIAVPLVAVANAVIQHLAEYTEPGEDPELAYAEDRAAAGSGPPPSLDEVEDRLEAGEMDEGEGR